MPRKMLAFATASRPLPSRLLVGLALSLVVLSACSKPVQTEQLAPVVSTALVNESKDEGTGQSVYSAVVVPQVQVDLAFRASGYVESILQLPGLGGRKRLVQPGDLVRKGMVLATVKQTEYAARLSEQNASSDESRAASQRAQAALSQAQVALDQAQAEFDRTSRLFAQTSVTKPEYDGAQTKLEMSKARLKEAQAQVDACAATTTRLEAARSQARMAMNDCLLKAPYDCLVVKRAVEVGSLAANGTTAFSICDPKAVKVSFGVPDVQVGRLQIGQSVSCLSEAVPGVRFVGKVSDIAPYAEARGRVFNVDFSLANPGYRLRPGMIMFLSINDNAGGGQGEIAEARLTIPLSAVVRSSTNPDGYSVFVTVADGAKFVAQERDVKLGDAFGQRVAVLDGLRKGDTIVTNGATRILPGQEVRVLD